MAHWSLVSPWRPYGSGQNLTLGSASVQSTAVSDYTQAVRLSATGNCHVAIGPNPTATATSMLLKSSDGPEIIKVAPGEKVAVIQDGTSTGTLNIVEFTH